MPKVTRTTDPEYEFAYEYICYCGKKIKLLSREKPERLVRCFDCIKIIPSCEGTNK